MNRKMLETDRGVKNENSAGDRTARNKYRKSLKGLLAELLFAALLILIFNCVFGICVQHGQGMYPAIKDGDIVLYYRTHKILNTEAVVYENDGRMLVGRVEAQAGTEVSAAGDLQMTFDGIYLPISPDNGIYTKTYVGPDTKCPFTVTEDHYYILGDNRDDAEDSRTLGQISSRKIKGRIVTVIRRRQI